MNNELKRIRKVLYRHLPGGIEENYEKGQLAEGSSRGLI
jgi:hypothetical protein